MNGETARIAEAHKNGGSAGLNLANNAGKGSSTDGKTNDEKKRDKEILRKARIARSLTTKMALAVETTDKRLDSAGSATFFGR